MFWKLDKLMQRHTAAVVCHENLTFGQLQCRTELVVELSLFLVVKLSLPVVAEIIDGCYVIFEIVAFDEIHSDLLPCMGR
jgi:hypothetical protein